MELELKLQIELIKALGSILTATIPTVVAYFLGRKVLNNAKIKNQLRTALNDLRFMLSVEDLHCRHHKESNDVSRRTEMRKSVLIERGQQWSGKNTTSKIATNLKTLS